MRKAVFLNNWLLAYTLNLDGFLQNSLSNGLLGQLAGAGTSALINEITSTTTINVATVSADGFDDLVDSAEKMLEREKELDKASKYEQNLEDVLAKHGSEKFDKSQFNYIGTNIEINPKDIELKKTILQSAKLIPEESEKNENLFPPVILIQRRKFSEIEKIILVSSNLYDIIFF